MINFEKEIPPVVNLDLEKYNIDDIDGLEDWQVDALYEKINTDDAPVSSAYDKIDSITLEWMAKLTHEQWADIDKRRSLWGIPIPKEWVKVWRLVLKTPRLRDSWSACRGGRAIGTMAHLWNLQAEQSIVKYLNDMEKELMSLNDQGYLHSEIGAKLLADYGDKFWKPRKKDTKTTPEQVVNNYLYTKMPTKIARGELTEMVLGKLDKIKRQEKRPS